MSTEREFRNEMGLLSELFAERAAHAATRAKLERLRDAVAPSHKAALAGNAVSSIPDIAELRAALEAADDE